MPSIGDHNERQRQYFEGSEQRTLKPSGSPYLRRHVDQMLKFSGIQAGDRVLELGCGLGRYTHILVERGVRVEGLDLAPQLLERLRESNQSDYEIPLHPIDILAAPRSMDGSFDSVIGFFVLHHVHDLQACITRAVELTKPGGSIAFIEPNPLNPLYYVQITLTPEMRWSNERGMLQMRPLRISEMLRRSGLRGTGFERFGFFPSFVTNHGPGLRLESAMEKIPPLRPFLPFQLFGGRRG